MASSSRRRLQPGLDFRRVLLELQGRGIAVPDPARERILAEKDSERLTRWLERAGVATSIDDLLGDAR